MKIHKLLLTNVGPYKGTHEIDFGQFVDSKIFLIEGPTGSGKSMLLDALVFGLYGAPATEGASANRMRSDFAKPDAVSEIRVVFECKRGIYSIARSPKYERPTKRNTSSKVTVQPSVLLQRLPNVESRSGEVVSSKLREADTEITRIIGLNRNQFRQTIILPQGEFARFLTAKSEDRKEILHSIFRTQVFAQTEKVLRERSSLAEHHQARQIQALRDQLAKFSGIAAIDPLEVDIGTVDISTTELADLVAEYLATALSELERNKAKAAKRCKKASIRRGRSESTYQTMISDQDNYEKQQELLAKQVELAGQQEVIAEHSQTIKTVTAALALKPQLEALTNAANKQLDAQEQLPVTKLRLSQACEGLQGSDLEFTMAGSLSASFDDQRQLTTVLKRLNSRIDQISPFIESEASLVAAQSKLKKLADQQDTLEAELSKLAASEESAASESDICSKQLQGLDNATATLERAQADYEKLQRQLAAAQKVDGLEAEKIKINSQLAKVIAKNRTAEKHLQELQQARISGMAGELAQTLTPDSSCAVCGSLEHPNPAKLLADHPTEAEIAAASENLEVLRAQLLTSQEADNELRRKFALEKDRAGSQSIAALAELLVESQNALDQATLRVTERSNYQEQKHQLDKSISKLTEQKSVKAIELATTEQQLRHESDQVANLRQAIQAERGDYQSIQDRITTLREVTTELEQAIAITGELLDLEQKCNDMEDTLAQAMLASHISDTNQLVELVAKEDAVPSIRATVEKYHAAVALTQQQLAKPEIRTAQPVAKGAIDQAEQKLAEYSTKLERRQDELSVASSALMQSTAQTEIVSKELAKYQKLTSENEALVRLSRIVNAKDKLNSRGISLETFVLLNQFDRVVDAANIRLQKFSQGRFTLYTSPKKQGRDRKAGLNLEILDHNTEKLRTLGDISGGETFYVSLSLALGLADVVTSQSGGIELGTLLIDEGFGTLSPEVLDQVMAVVSELSNSHRSVGIISHVEELKNTITDQIHVIQNEDSTSTLKFSI